MKKLVETVVDSDKCPHCGLLMQTEEHEETCSCQAQQATDHRSSRSPHSAEDWSDVT